MPIIDQLASDKAGCIVELGHGDVYICVGEDHQHVPNSVMFVHHNKPHRIGEMHKELEGKPITDFEKVVVIHFADDALASAEITLSCLLAVINRMRKVPDNYTMEQQLLDILINHCGQRGRSEGAVETLKRIIDERDLYELQLATYLKTNPAPIIINNGLSGIQNG